MLWIRAGSRPSRDGFEPEAAVGSMPLGALTALVGLRTARVRSGERILVVGGAGAVGTAAIQLVRHLGASVDAVCGASGLGLCAVVVLGELGALIGPPSWLLEVSPFAHVPRLPVQAMAWAPVTVMTLVSAALTGAAVIGYRRPGMPVI